MAGLCLVGLFSLPAQAVIITVDGVDYDVVYFSNGYDELQPSFNENEATLTDTATAPWWGNAALAEDFARAYLAQVPAGSFDVTSDVNALFFAYQPDPTRPTRVDFWLLNENGIVNSGDVPVDVALTSQVFAYTVPIVAAVPEIDGNALAKALFILFALGAWLHTRRARAA